MIRGVADMFRDWKAMRERRRTERLERNIMYCRSRIREIRDRLQDLIAEEAMLTCILEVGEAGERVSNEDARLFTRRLAIIRDDIAWLPLQKEMYNRDLHEYQAELSKYERDGMDDHASLLLMN